MAHAESFFCLRLLLLALLTPRAQQGILSSVLGSIKIIIMSVHIDHACIAGVSLMVQGVTIPNNSLVDAGDILYRIPKEPHPNNTNGLQTLMCVTDLVNCCETQGYGDWYFPNRTQVPFHTGFDTYRTFLANRGQYEEINGRQFYGSVRLWSRWSPIERGHFRCELPNDVNPSVNQILYVNIGEIYYIKGDIPTSVCRPTNHLIQWTLKE